MSQWGLLRLLRTGAPVMGDPYRIDSCDVIEFDALDLVYSDDDMIRVKFINNSLADWTRVPRADLNNTRGWKGLDATR
jgi:hypothetical protein